MEMQSSLIPLQEEQQLINTKPDADGPVSGVNTGAAKPPMPVASEAPTSPVQKKVRGRPSRPKDAIRGSAARDVSNDACVAGAATLQSDAVRAHMDQVMKAGILETLWSKGALTELEFRDVVGPYHRGASCAETIASLCSTILGVEGIAHGWAQLDVDKLTTLTLKFTLTEAGRARLVDGGFVPDFAAKWVQKALVHSAGVSD